MYVQLSCTCIVRLRLGYCVSPTGKRFITITTFFNGQYKLLSQLLAVNFSVDKLSTGRLTARQGEMLMKANLFRATRLLIMKLTTNTI